MSDEALHVTPFFHLSTAQVLRESRGAPPGMRAGQLRPAEANGRRYLCTPVEGDDAPGLS